MRVPGDWVVAYDGVSNDFGPAELQEVYDPGDIIAILIYDGQVFKKPSFVMTGEGADP